MVKKTAIRWLLISLAGVLGCSVCVWGGGGGGVGSGRCFKSLVKLLCLAGRGGEGCTFPALEELAERRVLFQPLPVCAGGWNLVSVNDQAAGSADIAFVPISS